MKFLVRAAAVAALWASLGSCGFRKVTPAAGPDREADKSAILAAEAAWAEAVAQHDVEAVLAYFTEDGASLPPDEELIIGTETRRAYLTRLFAEPDFESGWETTKVEISASGDLALSMGTTTHAGRTEDGQAFTERGKYITIWRKENGQWKVVADMWNSTEITPVSAPTPAP